MSPINQAARRPLQRVVLGLPLSESQLTRLRAALGPAELIRVSTKDQLEEELPRADAAFVSRELDIGQLEQDRLGWVHCDHSGLEGMALPEVFERGLIVTGSAGKSAAAMSELALLFMLQLAFDSPQHARAQRRRRFQVKDPTRIQPLVGQTLGIVGLGHTGSALAVRAKALGMQVVGYRRKALPAPEGVDEVLSASGAKPVDGLLERSDYVVLAASLNDTTHRLMGDKQFRAMKRTGFLINVARGALVDEPALVSALSRGTIAGAGLNSFVHEPLDPNSPLWSTPRTLVTPHLAPADPGQSERAFEILLENVRRYHAKEPMLNALSPEDVYTHLAKRRRVRRKKTETQDGFWGSVRGLFGAKPRHR